MFYLSENSVVVSNDTIELPPPITQIVADPAIAFDEDNVLFPIGLCKTNLSNPKTGRCVLTPCQQRTNSVCTQLGSPFDGHRYMQLRYSVTCQKSAWDRNFIAS